MSSEAPKAAKEAFVPKYEISAGLHKGMKLEKFVPKRVRPTRRVQVMHDSSEPSNRTLATILSSVRRRRANV